MLARRAGGQVAQVYANFALGAWLDRPHPLDSPAGSLLQHNGRRRPKQRRAAREKKANQLALIDGNHLRTNRSPWRRREAGRAFGFDSSDRNLWPAGQTSCGRRELLARYQRAISAGRSHRGQSKPAEARCRVFASSQRRPNNNNNNRRVCDLRVSEPSFRRRRRRRRQSQTATMAASTGEHQDEDAAQQSKLCSALLASLRLGSILFSSSSRSPKRPAPMIGYF